MNLRKFALPSTRNLRGKPTLQAERNLTSSATNVILPILNPAQPPWDAARFDEETKSVENSWQWYVPLQNAAKVWCRDPDSCYRYADLVPEPPVTKLLEDSGLRIVTTNSPLKQSVQQLADLVSRIARAALPADPGGKLQGFRQLLSTPNTQGCPPGLNLYAFNSLACFLSRDVSIEEACSCQIAECRSSGRIRDVSGLTADDESERRNLQLRIRVFVRRLRNESASTSSDGTPIRDVATLIDRVNQLTSGVTGSAGADANLGAELYGIPTFCHLS